MDNTGPVLFTALKIKHIELKNRITVSPMCMYSSKDGFADSWHLVHLGSRAVGGAGLVFTEATAVSPEGRISPYDLGIWKEEHLEGLSRIVQFGESQGSVMGIQLAHAGRKASTTPPWKGGTNIPPSSEGWQTLAPSGIPFRQTDTIPGEITTKGIQKVIGDFQAAAKRSLQAGFKVLEVHAAHGYLLHQFLSPLSNKRTDEYGGVFENRIRLLLEVLEAVKKEWPEEYPLFVRISATDWIHGGWDLPDSIALAQRLKASGVDLLDCSSGGIAPDIDIPIVSGYQVGFAQEIKKKAAVLTGAVGLITTAEESEAILARDQADLIFIAREFLRDPYFPLNAAKKLGMDLQWPPQYERAKLKT